MNSFNDFVSSTSFVVLTFGAKAGDVLLAMFLALRKDVDVPCLGNRVHQRINNSSLGSNKKSLTSCFHQVIKVTDP